MPSSSPLAIASNSVTRLLKECKYYEEDIAAQRRKISELKQEIQQGNDADNAGYLLKQRVSRSRVCLLVKLVDSPQERALSETETVLTSMPEKIQSARERLESSMVSATAPMT